MDGVRKGLIVVKLNGEGRARSHGKAKRKQMEQNLAFLVLGFGLYFARALAAACWKFWRTTLASLFGKFERCTIRT